MREIRLGRRNPYPVLQREDSCQFASPCLRLLVVGLFFTSLPFTERTHHCGRRIALLQGHRFAAANKRLVSLPDLLLANGKEMRSSPARRRLSSYRGRGPATPQLVGIVSGRQWWL
nr:hypothetical protein Iba_chr07cCG5290 [Ipomoea batatas]